MHAIYMSSLLTRVSAAKLDSWVAHVCDTLTVLLVAQVHAVCISIAAPAQWDAQAVHPTLKLICVTTPRRTCGCRETSGDLKMASPSILPKPI